MDNVEKPGGVQVNAHILLLIWAASLLKTWVQLHCSRTSWCLMFKPFLPVFIVVWSFTSFLSISRVLFSLGYTSVMLPGLQRSWSTLSPARTLKEAMTWSAVSVSAVSRDMKSMKAWKVTMPILLGSTMLMMRENSFSPWRQERGTVREFIDVSQRVTFIYKKWEEKWRKYLKVEYGDYFLKK